MNAFIITFTALISLFSNAEIILDFKRVDKMNLK